VERGHQIARKKITAQANLLTKVRPERAMRCLKKNPVSPASGKKKRKNLARHHVRRCRRKKKWGKGCLLSNMKDSTGIAASRTKGCAFGLLIGKLGLGEAFRSRTEEGSNAFPRIYRHKRKSGGTLYPQDSGGGTVSSMTAMGEKAQGESVSVPTRPRRL